MEFKYRFMFSPRVRRYIVIVALLICGGAIIALISNSYGRGPETLMSELVAVLLLLGAAMGAGFLAALGLRALRNAKDKADSKNEK